MQRIGAALTSPSGARPMCLTTILSEMVLMNLFRPEIMPMVPTTQAGAA